MVESKECQKEELSTAKNNPVKEVDNSDAFLFFISFLLPIVGIISGSILLTTDNKKKIGRDCVLFSLAGMLMAGLIAIVIKVV